MKQINNKHLKIISAFTDNIREVSDMSYNSYLNFCKKNEIEFYRVELNNLERPAPWYKIQLILQEFSNGYEYVMWVDADTLLLNEDFNIQEILNNTSEIFISQDVNALNTGVMIWKNTENNKNILNKIWSLTEFLNHPWWENAAFMSLYEQNYNNIQTIVEKVPQKILNAYDYNLYNLTYDDGQVDDKSFIIHFPGLPNNQRVTIMKGYKL
jgi:hypothetical protein